MRRFALLLGVLAVGCVPVTEYRYSAMTPSPRPVAWDGRTPRSGLVVEGSLSTGSVVPNYTPKLHDTALWVARHSLDGFVGVVPIEGVQVGVRGAWAEYRWADASAAGTMPLPSEPNIFGFGPDVRVSVKLDRAGHAAIGVAGSMLVYSIPYARWRLCNGSPSSGGLLSPRSATCSAPGPIYDGYFLQDTGSELHFVFAGGLYPSYGFGPNNKYGRVFGMFGASSGFTNDGFTDKLQSGSTIGTHAVPLFGAGYGIDADFIRASVMFYTPLTRRDDGVFYGPGVMITLGTRIPLFEGPRALGLDL